MAMGMDLILAAALCISCPSLPPPAAGFVSLDANGDVLPVNRTDGGDEILTDKAMRLKELRDWINGTKLVIGTLEDYPLSYTKIENGTVVGCGVSFELLNFLSDKFNFTYETIKPASNIIGSSEDFSNSLIEMLNQTRVDLAAAFVPLLTEPRRYILYSTTTLDEGEWIMVMNRPKESATGSGLMAPFDFWVWILILVSLLVVGPIIYFLIILRNKLTGDKEQKPYSLGHCAWFVYGALMKQGSTLSPIADSTRLLFATWWIFITILTSFYTANLTAFLTLSQFTLPFNTVEDILVKNKYFVSMRGAGVEYAIRNVNESLSILSPMIQRNRAVFTEITNDTQNLQTYVEKENFVYVRDRPAINHLLYSDYRYRKTISFDNEKIHCPFAMAKQPFLKKMRGFAYPIGSNLSELFDPELLNFVERGIVKHLSSLSLPNAEICPQNLGGTERQLRNGDLAMTYYIMIAGFATAIVVFSTELFFRYLNRSRDKQSDVQRTGQWGWHGIGRTSNDGLLLGPKLWLGRNREHADAMQAAPSVNNITPPPPYQSIFSSTSKVNNNDGTQFSKKLNQQRRWQHATGLENKFEVLLGGENNASGSRVGRDAGGSRRFINGRDYMVFRNSKGQSQLVPIRAPSAAIFQYTYTE